MRNRTVSRSDYDYLMERSASKLSMNEQNKFENAVRLMTTNEKCTEYNIKKLISLNVPIARIRAEDTSRNTARISPDNAGGLIPELLLGTGARVMLTRNLSTKHGLINGSFGTIKAILYEENVNPPNLPKAVIVEFDDFNGQPLLQNHPKWVAITPQSSEISLHGNTSYRRQLPLKLAWAITIHKSQGLTLNKAVVHLGQKAAFAKGLEFVAISRVKKITDLMVQGISFERFKKINSTQSERKTEENRLKRLNDETRRKYAFLKNEDIHKWDAVINNDNDEDIEMIDHQIYDDISLGIENVPNLESNWNVPMNINHENQQIPSIRTTTTTSTYQPGFVIYSSEEEETAPTHQHDSVTFSDDDDDQCPMGYRLRTVNGLERNHR